MADLLPVSDIARLDVPLAQLDTDLQFLRLKREAEARMNRLAVAAHQYDVDHLDADSRYVLPGSYPVGYVNLRGES